MIWSTPGLVHHGPFVMRLGERYHYFSTRLPEGSTESLDRLVSHYVSTDTVTWEQWPDVMGVGPEGAFDGYTLYDLCVTEHAGRFYLHYTGIDRPMGPGQKQRIGLAVSDDLVHWRRHGDVPVLDADPRFYEQSVAPEATYQEKDRGRLWFRDPWVHFDAASGQYVMIVGARDAHAHPDVAGCLACAVSNDLIRWTPRPPLYSPARFHTLECPSLLDEGGRHYAVFMTHPGWGAPFITTDPWQVRGSFYAVSQNGLFGAYERPDDELLVGGQYERTPGDFVMRAGLVKPVRSATGDWLIYHTAGCAPSWDDDQSKPVPGGLSAPFKRLRFAENGEMHVMWTPESAQGRSAIHLPGGRMDPSRARSWRMSDEGMVGKNFSGRSVLLGQEADTGTMVETRIRFLRGERAGLALRASSPQGPGWQVILDRRFGRVEFGLLDGTGFIDARRWAPSSEEVSLRVLTEGPCVEVYVDDRLMLFQARYREKAGRVGLVVERAEAQFAVA